MGFIRPEFPLPSSSTAIPKPLGNTSKALYLPRAVGLATFLGSPLAGSIIMAMNYRRTGESQKAVTTVILGLIATAAMIVLGFMLPEHGPTYGLAVIPLVIMVQLAKSLQGTALAAHQASGGKIASNWRAAGIGLLTSIVLVAIIFAVCVVGAMAAQRSMGTRVDFSNGEVYYAGNATAAETQALGKALTDAGYFNSSRRATVFLFKDSSQTVVQFVIDEYIGKKPETLAAYSKLIDLIAPAVGGKPITLNLISPEMKQLQSKKIE